jgi:cardiolipin synthase
MEPTEGAPAPSDAILTVPNLLTFFRLALVPVFLWLALGEENMGAAVAVAFVGFLTDLVDGKIARRYGQVSKLGILLDPLSDRLGLASGGVVLIVHDIVPLWAVIVVLARDALLVLVGAPILRARNVPIPAVSSLGKKASFAISLTMGFFLASGITSVTDPSDVLLIAGWVFFALGVPAYYFTAYDYTRAGLRGLSRDASERPG